jgi:hypothetical protein
VPILHNVEDRRWGTGACLRGGQGAVKAQMHLAVDSDFSGAEYASAALVCKAFALRFQSSVEAGDNGMQVGVEILHVKLFANVGA